jgi:hypothetical protein
MLLTTLTSKQLEITCARKGVKSYTLYSDSTRIERLCTLSKSISSIIGVFVTLLKNWVVTTPRYFGTTNVTLRSLEVWLGENDEDL